MIRFGPGPGGSGSAAAQPEAASRLPVSDRDWNPHGGSRSPMARTVRQLRGVADSGGPGESGLAPAGDSDSWADGVVGLGLGLRA